MSTLLGSILSVIRTDDLKFYFKNGPETDQDADALKKRVSGVAELALALSKEALQAVMTLQFSAFDALIRNNGCQITAVEVCDIFQSAPPFSDAAVLASLVDGASRALEKLKSSAPPIDLGTILNDSVINPPVSLPLSKLLRFYVLRKARKVQVKGGVEAHVTDARLIKVVSEVSRDILDKLVNKLQVQESQEAAAFITSLDDRIVPYKKGEITFTRLIENFEVCLNFFKGLAIFSNKTQMGGRSLEGVTKIEVAVSFPDGSPLPDFSTLPPERPVLFVEGTFLNNDPSELICAAKVGRLVPYLLKQGKREQKNKVCSFKIDHFFCKSVREVVCADSL